jgi:hypothetical protein
MKGIKLLNFRVNVYMYSAAFFWLILLPPTSAFCQDKKGNFITLEDFGVTANGKDETAGILKAFQFARQQKKSIKLLNGKVYIFSPAATVDITGIPEISGSGTFDVSNTGKNAGNPSMTAIFQLTGTKKLVQSNISGMQQNKNSLQLSSGLNLGKGSILFLTSAEPLANTKRKYYTKGQRAVVKSYNNASGLLVIEDRFFYTINKAYVWINNQMPAITVGEKVRFITSPMNFISCFRMYYAEGFISGYYKNFALTAIMFKSSQGEVNNMEAELPVTDNNGYSYCIMAGDMSAVNIKNCTLSGGRHVITGGGGGLWELEESGGKGHAAYPCVLTVDGGVYTGSKNVVNINADNATIDSHGVVEKMTIKNCTIYGGINLGANFVIVDNVTLYADTKRAFNVGSDVLPGSDWGNYTISNVKIIWDANNNNSVFFSKANVKELSLDNVSVNNLSPQTIIMDFRNNSPKKIYINKLSSKQIRSANFLKINRSSKVDITNSNLPGKNIQRAD